MISHYLRFVGRGGLNTFETVGRCLIMFWRTISGKPHAKLFALIIEQIFQLGILSLPIILTAGLFIGMVLGLQGYIVLVDYAAEQSLGSMVSLSLLRELGPVVAALLFAGRAGSALTAEIGLMKATEQLSSMEMMAVDPIRRIIAPRFFAGFISLPILTIIFMAVGVYSGYLVGSEWKGVDAGSFWSQIQNKVEFFNHFLNYLSYNSNLLCLKIDPTRSITWNCFH